MPVELCFRLDERAPKARETKRTNLRNWPILNDDVMDAYGFLGIFMTSKVLGSLSEVSRDSTNPMKTIAEEQNNF